MPPVFCVVNMRRTTRGNKKLPRDLKLSAPASRKTRVSELDLMIVFPPFRSGYCNLKQFAV